MNALAFLLVSTSLAVPVPNRKEPPKDAEKIQGVWNLIAAETRGRPMPAAVMNLPTYTLVVDGDRYVFSTHGGKLALDAAGGTADLGIQNGRNQGHTIPGRYKLDGDTLTLILPSAFSSSKRPPVPMPGQAAAAAVYTFRRDAKQTKEQAAALLKQRTAALPNAPLVGPGIGKIGQPGRPGFAGRVSPTQQMLQQIINQLERIEQRLDALEKRLPREKK